MRYLLDTNVVSELRKGRRASPAVTAWYRQVDYQDLFLSTLTFGELRRGIEGIARRDPRTAHHLEVWLKSLAADYLARILPVNLEIADLWGCLCPGQPLPFVDGLLAATAIYHDLTFVTRNVADVTRSGVRILNPFEAPLGA